MVVNRRMSIRRNGPANGYVTHAIQRRRRRNALGNIFTEFSEHEVSELREQAREMVPSSPEVVHTRRRRNAIHDISVGISEADLSKLIVLQEEALHPAALETTPPGAPRSSDGPTAAESGLKVGFFKQRTSRSMSLCYPLEAGATAIHLDGYLLNNEAPSRSSHSTATGGGGGTRTLQRSISVTTRPVICSELAQPVSSVFTDSDEEIYRDRISRSSNRYRQRRNAVCYEDSTQDFLNNIITAVIKCRLQKREARLNSSSSSEFSD